MKRAIFPGTFDPITVGHTEIIDRGLRVFDQIVVAIGVNSEKKTMFTTEQRVAMIEAAYKDEPRVSVQTYTGLTVNYAIESGIPVLLRGLRNGQDLAYETPISTINRRLAPEVETVFLLTAGEAATISSSLIREVIRYKGKLEGLVPDSVIPLIFPKS